MQFASLDEVWGSTFPKKHPMTSKFHTSEPKRDAVREGRVASTPHHRSATAMTSHKKTIDDLSSSLPIVEKDDVPNFTPERIVASKEHFTMEKKYPADIGADFPYAPPNFQDDARELKLNRILHLIEQQQMGMETPSSQDMMLYVFTGIFFLFTFDTFVSMGRRLK